MEPRTQQKKNSLDNLRQEIDKIDNELFLLLQKRSRVVELVAKFKIDNNLPVYQPEREKAVLEHKEMLARQYGLNPKFIIELYSLIMKSSRDTQEQIIKRQ